MLCVRYIRIDSLCIVQDDRRDWEEQAPLTFDIYSNALLTIVATRVQGVFGYALSFVRQNHTRL
ncbi:hypothetical protein F5B21DRAFT_455019 [Xylaria acuta]|nr:hypothetical protein F5B21DRAFT_455019 [Xylaria acuta]